MLDTLISSKTRLKLLLKFFLNSKSSAYLRGLECEFGESTNAIRIELNRFESAGLLETHMKGNKKIYQANPNHPIFPDIQNILKKFIGIDQIVDKILSRLGEIEKVYITGDFANGKDSQVIDLMIIANHLDRSYLSELIEKTEKLISRKIRYINMLPEEFLEYKKQKNGNESRLLIYSKDK
ncbi:MAG: ArsR family transcriptional regulator [Bacteroidia bacterium]|nr:ArsR family transcriptional regulator [Bacteroidia bacterium]